MDAEVRRLEVVLAADPTDVGTRQRLLSAYLRTGILQRNDIPDLAALGDLGAEALLGRKVDLQSRSKRFYLRCVWVIASEVIRQSGLSESSQIFSDIGQVDERLADEIPYCIQIFTELMENYLAGRAKLNSELPFKYYSDHSGIHITNFELRFRDLHQQFRQMDLAGEPYTQERKDSRFLLDILHMLHLIAGAASGNVKRNTDRALRVAVYTLNGLRGLYFTLYNHNQHNAQLWQELVQQGAIQAAPVLPVRPPDQPNQPIPHNEELYFETASRQLIKTYRNLIIRHWLPNYSP